MTVVLQTNFKKKHENHIKKLIKYTTIKKFPKKFHSETFKIL